MSSAQKCYIVTSCIISGICHKPQEAISVDMYSSGSSDSSLEAGLKTILNGVKSRQIGPMTER